MSVFIDGNTEDEIHSLISSLPEEPITSEYELEIRLGYKEHKKQFVPGITKEKWELLLHAKKLYISSKIPVEQNSIVFLYHNGDIYRSIKYKKKLEHMNKSRIKNIFINKYIRLSLSEEIVVDKKKNMQIEKVRYRNRISRKSKDKMWRFDFTKTAIKDWTTKDELKTWISNQEKEYTFEIEIEYIGNKKKDRQIIYDSLLEQINNINKIIPIHDNSNRFDNVYNEIINLFNRSFHYNKKFIVGKDSNEIDFRKLAPQVFPLKIQNIPIVEENYAITDKADGERMLFYISNKNTYVIDANMKFKLTHVIIQNDKMKKTLIDGEYIKELDTFMMFDMIIYNGNDITQEPFKERYEKLVTIKESDFHKNKKSSFKIKTKKHYLYGKDFGKDKPLKNIYDVSNKVVTKKFDYELDGIIFTPMNKEYYNRETYKWKDITTIDFLIYIDKKVNGIATLHLYSLINRKDYNKYIKLGIPLQIEKDKTYYNKFPFVNNNDSRFPVRFIIEYQGKILNLYECQVKINKDNKTEDGILIKNVSIVEFKYDTTVINEKKRWIPIRYREDRTKELNNRIDNGNHLIGANAYWVAEDNMKLILNPITIDMITGKKSIETTYFTDAKKDLSINNMKWFHSCIKRSLYVKYGKNIHSILDLASGRGADIWKLADTDAFIVVMLEIDEVAIEETKKRLISLKNNYERKSKRIPDFYVLRADLSERILPILKTIKSKIKKTKFDLITCHFAMHYLLESEGTFKIFFKNIDKHLKKNGWFIATLFDGQRILNFFKKKEINVNEEFIWKEGDKTIFKLKRLFEKDTLDNFGQPIDVYVESLGSYHREYLFNFEYIKKYFEEHGYRLIETQLFKDFIKCVNKMKKGRALSKSEKKWSFFNRFIVFQKL